MTQTTQKAALVLSGGAALGAAHLGVLQALEDRKVEFDFVCGVSAGALVGAFIACGHSPASAWEVVQKTKLLRLLFDFSGSRMGLIGGEKLLRLFEEVFEGRTFEDLKVPFYVGTTDFETGEKVIISSGKISAALRASVSVPVFFEPYFHSELKRYLVDGGLVENLPLTTALELYHGINILAVDVATMLGSLVDSTGKKKSSKRHLLASSLSRTLRIMLKRQQHCLPTDPRVKFIRPNTGNYMAADIRKLDELYQLGIDTGKGLDLSNLRTS